MLYLLQHINGYVAAVFDSYAQANQARLATDKNDRDKWVIIERELNKFWYVKT